MSLLKTTNMYKKKIEAKFAQPNKIDFPKSEIIKEIYPVDKKLNSTLMIGEGVTITGNIIADNEVIIQGIVEGDVECNVININQSGKIKGNIKSKNMNIEGVVDGEINVKDVLTIKSKGKLSGKINYGKIQIDEGGQLSGETAVCINQDKLEEKENWKSL